jgi:formate dehydrogenase major subunit
VPIAAGGSALRRVVRALADAARERDETLQHPRCVFQILRPPLRRYTPEMVEQT